MSAVCGERPLAPNCEQTLQSPYLIEKWALETFSSPQNVILSCRTYLPYRPSTNCECVLPLQMEFLEFQIRPSILTIFKNERLLDNI